nr:flagellar hook assembly protein FlgD [uncultured Deefgea sp.]
MATISNNFNYTSLNTKKTANRTEAEKQQDTFMKLLVKQLQTQDPMNPMDNAQTTSQMAQINTVTGIGKLNETMNQMQSLYAGTQVMQAAGLIGKEVLTPGNGFRFDGTTKADLRVSIPEGASDVMLSVFNKDGTEVAKIPANSSQPGLAQLEWDGKKADGSVLPAGDYTVAAKGQKDGKEIALDTVTWQVAKSVEFGSSGVGVYLANGGKTGFGDVIQIRSASGSTNA